MNRYPLWKYILIAVIVAVSALYALPNIYGKDPAVQVSSSRGQAGDLLDLLAEFAPDPALRNRILVRNPETLYDFG